MCVEERREGGTEPQGHWHSGGASFSDLFCGEVGSLGHVHVAAPCLLRLVLCPCRDHFCQQLDNSTSGIKATIGKLMQLLEVHDPQLAAHLQKNKVGA